MYIKLAADQEAIRNPKVRWCLKPDCETLISKIDTDELICKKCDARVCL